MAADLLHGAALALLAGGGTPTAVARDAGYRSERAFALAFARRFHAAPEAMRGWGKAGGYAIDYRGPFHLPETLRYLGRDPNNLAERVEGRAYTRYFPVRGRPLLVTLAFGRSACRVTAPRPADPAAALLLHMVLRRFLGLEQPLAEFYAHVERHKVLGPLVLRLRGVRIPQLPTLWEALCWAVVGQQINLAFAYKLRNRLIALGNGADGYEGGGAPAAPLPFPGPEQVLRLTPAQLREHQFSRQKASYLLGLARACAEGAIEESALRALPAGEAALLLRGHKGLGPWSVAYALMRGLGHPDALPIGDTGLRTALQRQFRLKEPPTPRRQEQLMEPLRPFRSLATYYLWKSLNAHAGD